MYGDPSLRVGGEDGGEQIRRAEEGQALGDATRGGLGGLGTSADWALGTVRGDAAASVARQALEFCEKALLNDGMVALRCEQQIITRNGARTKGLFSITCLIRVLQLLLLLCGYIALLARMLLLADAMHAAMAAAYAASPNASTGYRSDIDQVYAVQGVITFVLRHRHTLFAGNPALLARAERLLAFMRLEMWCRFTLMGQRRLEALEFPDLGDHLDQMAATSDIPNIAYVFADMRNFPHNEFPLLLLSVPSTITKDDGNDVYYLTGWCGWASADQIGACGQAYFAAFGFGGFVALTETLHGRRDARLSEGESAKVRLMAFGRVGRAPGRMRHPSTLGPSLCLRGLDGPRSDTLGGCPLTRARPHPNNPAFRRLCEAGAGPYGVLPLHDRAVVADVFAVLNARGPLGTMVAGQREPAEILARGPRVYFAPVYDVRMPAA